MNVVTVAMNQANQTAIVTAKYRDLCRVKYRSTNFYLWFFLNFFLEFLSRVFFIQLTLLNVYFLWLTNFTTVSSQLFREIHIFLYCQNTLVKTQNIIKIVTPFPITFKRSWNLVSNSVNLSTIVERFTEFISSPLIKIRSGSSLNCLNNGVKLTNKCIRGRMISILS